MLTVVEEAYRSDVGRQRSANEDSYYARAPLFAVADGMGGAQAGEVASRIAAESFTPDVKLEASPETYLRQVAEDANARIHRLAQADASRSGMGTTLTAALLDGDELSFAHVGDSRAYRWRDGELKLLTSDHSLVEELRRQGRLTDAQAEDHPQRSIITRALGPEPQVEVDTMTYRARPDDVYLICSDGLTTMIKEARIAEILGASGTLEQAVDALIADANAAGGRDNITVVAFRLADADPSRADDGATLVGPTAEEAGLSGEAVRAAASQERRRAALGGAAAEHPPVREPERRSRRRLVLTALIAVAVSVGLAVFAVWGVRQIYFLGSDSGGRLALYRGLPYELPFGLKLYSEQYAAPIQVSDIPKSERSSATDHTLRFHDDAASLVRHLTAVANQPKPVLVPPKPPKPKPKPPANQQRQKPVTKQKRTQSPPTRTQKQKANPANGKPQGKRASGGNQ
jgi:PPM family protein phosphatase